MKRSTRVAGLLAVALVAPVATFAAYWAGPVRFTLAEKVKADDGTDMEADAVITYNLYGGECSGGRPLPKLNPAPLTFESFPFFRTPAEGKLHCYQFEAVSSKGTISDLSPELQVDKRVPPKKPAAPKVALSPQ